ncbi:MAG TPA: ferritin-like domain-containing protein [Gaiellaceae bacterium]
MSHLPTLDELDVDGAIREAAEKVDANTRRAFLRKAGLGAGAAVASGAFFGVLPSIASAGVAASDVAILNYALTLEYLEAAFYAEAHKAKFPGKVGTFARIVAGHEAAHVSFLKGALGSAAVKKPNFNFKGTTTNKAKFTATAQVLEDTGVEAYLGQVGNIKSKTILAAAGSILPIEARHAGWVRDLNNTPGAPAAFQVAKTKAQVLAIVKSTGFIV